jgi:thymidylate synthase
MIEADNALECWKQALKLVSQKGIDFVDQNKKPCRQFLNLVTTVKRPDVNITEPIELLNSFKTWKYPKLEEIKNVVLSSKSSLDYSYSYGQRIFNFDNAVNQIDNFIIPLLKDHPNSRRAVISLWNPPIDSSLTNKQVPGLIAVDFKIVNDSLCITGIIRSNDMLFGWPANIYQLFTLQDYVRKKLDLVFGSLTIVSISAHIFKDQFGIVDQILS